MVIFVLFVCVTMTLTLCLCVCALQGTSVLSPVLHIGSVIILAMMIYKKSAVQLFEKHPCLYILAFGCVSAKITNKLVVSRLSSFFSFFFHKGQVAPSAVIREKTQSDNDWLKYFLKS